MTIAAGPIARVILDLILSVSGDATYSVYILQARASSSADAVTPITTLALVIRQAVEEIS